MRHAALLLLAAPVIWAQSRTSAISGEVLDPASRPVEGASVTAVSVERGTVHATLTGAGGSYRIAELAPGSYDIRVDKAGFSASIRPAVRLTLDIEVRLVHSLTLAETRNEVTIAAEPVSAASTPSSVTGLIGRERIQELPLIGRDYLQLSILQPGVHVARAYATNNNGGFGQALSISGSRPVQNTFRLDGVHLTNQTGSTPGSLLGVNLGVEAIQEFSLTSSAYSAAAGRGAGGMVHAATRSGTNDPHGSAYYFHRNSAFDARNFFDASKTAAFRRHQFGGALGGPVRANRTFFFANAEAINEFTAGASINTTISDAAREGRLTAGTVPVDPAIRRWLALLPRPNREVFGDTGLFYFANPVQSDETFVTSRLDHQWSSRDMSFLRYTFDRAQREDLTNFALARRSSKTLMHSAAAEHTHIFSPALYGTARFGWLRSEMDMGQTEAVDRSLDDPSLAFVTPGTGPGIVYVNQLSTFEGATGGTDKDLSQFDSYQTYNDYTWMRSRHLLRFGGSLEFTNFAIDSTIHPLGEFTFDTLASLLTNRALRFRAMMPGTNAVRRFRQEVAAWYIQDSIRLSRGLQIDLGLRHEWATVPREANGRSANLDRLSDPAMRTAGPLFKNPSLLNLVPRAGLAWDLRGDGRSVFRAGVGAYPDLILSHFLLLAGVRNPPYFLDAELRNPAQGAFPGKAYESLLTEAIPDYRVERLDPEPGQSMVWQWNASWQQTLSTKWMAQAIYSGSRGRNLSTIVEDANLVQPVVQPDGRLFFPAGGTKLNPAFGFIRNRLFNGMSSYHSLQTLLRRQWRQGSLFQAAYTFGKSIDDDSSTFARTDSSNSIGIPVDGYPGFNRGLSNHDVRHHLAVHGLWALPTPRGGARLWLGAWRIGALIAAGSGLPFSATLGYDAARTGTSRPDYRGGQRPDVNPAFTGPVATGDPARWFRPEAFLRPEPGYLGDLGRNTILGPAWFSADAMLSGDFALPRAEGWRLTLRLEVFNLSNHANFDLPGGRRSQVFTRTAIPEDAGRITSAGPARKWQGGLRLSF
jgi:hypothetical protein